MRNAPSNTDGVIDSRDVIARIEELESERADLAEDCGMISKDLAWPCTCIDWGQACRELKMDYTEVDFDGVSYFMRA